MLSLDDKLASIIKAANASVQSLIWGRREGGERNGGGKGQEERRGGREGGGEKGEESGGGEGTCIFVLHKLLPYLDAMSKDNKLTWDF